MKRFIILPCLILACFLLTGCFGLAVGHPRQKSTNQFCLGSRGMVISGTAKTNLTEAVVMDLWGQPDSKRTEKGGVNIWRYQGKYTWGILMPMYFIPVPIPFPAGHDHVDIYFKDGSAQKASRTVGVYTGAALAAPCEKGYMLVWEQEEKLDNPK
jgi:hypothetical protein